MTSFIDQIAQEVDERTNKRRRLDWLSPIAALGVGGLSCVAWLSTAHRVQRWRVALERSAAERMLAERAVRQAHDELEARVDQRTGELEDTNKALQTENTERERAEEVLLESEEKFRELAENITDVFWIRSPDVQQMHYISPAYEQIWGRSTASWYAHPEQWADAILPDDRDRVRAVFLKLVDEPSVSVEYQIWRPDGSIRWIHDRGFQVRDAPGRPYRTAGIAADITERKLAQEAQARLVAILEATTDLVAISNPEGQLIYLNRAGRNLMGSAVDVRALPAVGLQAVKADPGQIEQVTVNMALNGRHAMPKGGTLTLETANVTVDAGSADRDPELKPGAYVTLTITDTGTGMSADVRPRVFDPFFTTKGVGKGTGLGLATCYGIVKQSGGHISVASEPGLGSTFTIYLPQLQRPTEARPPLREAPGVRRGTEAILLVDDDPALRDMAATFLRRLGYVVLAAADGKHALSLMAQRGKEPIDLLFTDVVMPNLNGKELSDLVVRSHPETRTLFSSAFSENSIAHQDVLDPGAALRQEPFAPGALALKVREVDWG